MLTIYQAYDKSVDFVRAGEWPEAAIFHALQYEIDHPHDAGAMLRFWHERRLPSFDNRGYPRHAP